MKVGEKIKRIMAIVIMSWGLIIARPAHAFVWPTVDLTMITSFVSNISTGLGQVTTAIAQIKGYAATIAAIGDQASALAKFDDIIKAITSITQNITKITKMVKDVTQSIGGALDNFGKLYNEVVAERKQQAKTTTEVIEQQIEDEESEEDVQETLDEYKQDVEQQDINIKKEVEDIRSNIKTVVDQATESVDMLMETVIRDGDLDVNTQKRFKEEGNTIKERINKLQVDANDILDEMLENHNESYQNVMTAISDYSGEISRYYKKEITKEDFKKAGETFNAAISEASTEINSEKITKLMNEANAISNSIDDLAEDIIDSIANNKNYSDEDPSDKISSYMIPKTEKYVFNYHFEQKSMYLKVKDKSLYSGEEFLLPRGLRSGSSSSKCSKLTEDSSFGYLKDADKNRTKIRESLNDCVVRAKTEKEYFCGGNNNCDPYKMEKYYSAESYKKYGVYKHIFKDYSIANISNVNKIKQWVVSWEDINDDKSVISQFMKKLPDVNTTANAYALHGMVDIEEPKLWSRLRRIDAMQRAKDVVVYFKDLDSLYLDGRDDDYTTAWSTNRSKVSVALESGSEDKNVISNSFIYICDPNNNDMSGENISVEEDEADENAIKEAEEKIKRCLYNYATATTRGVDLTGANDYKTVTDVKEGWRKKEIKAVTDSMLDTLLLSTVNTYKSSRDEETAGSGEKTIPTLIENQKSLQTAREDYASGSEINNYAGHQVLTILDADAQALQTEIIKDISKMSYNFFDEEVESDKEGGD